MELINVSLSLRHELFLPSSDRVYHRSELEAENAEKELKVTNRWQRLNQLLKFNHNNLRAFNFFQVWTSKLNFCKPSKNILLELDLIINYK